MTIDYRAINAATAAACDQDATDLVEVTDALHETAKADLMHICARNSRLGISPLTTMSTYLQVSVQLLRAICPDGPLADMLRIQADLIEAAQAGRDPDPQLAAAIQQNGIALTMAARRAREGRNRPQ